MKVIYLISLLALFVALVFSAVVSADTTITWNQTGVFVEVEPLTQAQMYEGLVFNAYYASMVNESAYDVTLYAIKYWDTCPFSSVTFEVYDYYNHSLIGNYTIHLSVGEEEKLNVTVPSNITIIYINVGDEKLGPYYISYIPPAVAVPEELKAYAPLIPLAFLIAFTARGNTRDASYGLLAYAIMVYPICMAFGYESPVIPAVSSIGAFLAFIVLYLASH